MSLLAPSLRALLDQPEGQRKIGPFVLVRQLGRGGFAPVWLAKEIHGSTELRTAAVKLFSLHASADASAEAEAFRAKVIAEARALCQVEHPAIVRFYALPTNDERGVMGLAMEYVDGVPLDRRLAERGQLALADVLAVGTAVASALSAIHRAGLVHRDVKPANLVESAGGYKLIDFGIAALDAASSSCRPRRSRDERRVVELDELPLEVEGEEPSWLTGDGTPSGAEMAGTIGYVDPVCVATGAPATPASDLYGLGATLFVCLTGKLPAAASGASGRGLDAEVIDGRRAPPSLLAVVPEASEPLARLIDAMLAPDRATRPRSAEQVAIELERLSARLAGSARDLPPESVGPFRGLRRFEREDRDLYFGRASEVAAALEMLRSRPLVTLVGPSGSGKSSLARAGVVPRVAEGALGGWPKRWDVAVAVPGADARAAVEAALGALDPPVPRGGAIRPEALVEALAARAETNDRGLLLVVDQLEELGTLGSGDSQAWAIELFAALGDRTLPGVRLLATARRDLLDLLLGLGWLGKALVGGSQLVAPMTDAVWAEVVAEALAAYGYAFEDEALLGELLAELAGTASAMPLVQFALTQLWATRDTGSKTITRKGFASIGGIAGALERHAEATLLSVPAKESTVKGALLSLTTPRGTRAHATRDAVRRAGGEDSLAVLDRLEAARLVVREGEDMTLAHEALLAQWARLRRWVAEAREDRLLAEEIERDAERWHADRESAALWKKRRLVAAEDMRDRGTVTLSAAAAEFVAAARRAERRGQTFAAASVALVLLAAGLGGKFYVDRIGAEKARADEARTLAEQNLATATEKGREVAKAQERIQTLLAQLADAPDKEAMFALQERVKAMAESGPGSGRAAAPGAVATRREEAPLQAPAPVSAGPRVAPPPTTTAAIKVQKEW
jgi:serine/threonine protein kinase